MRSRRRERAASALRTAIEAEGGPNRNRNSGVDEETIRLLPTDIVDSHWIEANKLTKDCAVCLSEFEVGDEVKTLPACGHVFHRECVDPWLLAKGSCPLCRRGLHGQEASGSTAQVTETSSSEQPGRQQDDETLESSSPGVDHAVDMPSSSMEIRQERDEIPRGSVALEVDRESRRDNQL